jgi:DNA gyrase/topoisomerase IV subunit A
MTEHIPTHMYRETLLRTVEEILTEYMYYRALGAIAYTHGCLDKANNRDHLAEGLMIAAKKIEQAFTYRTDACTFAESKTNNMLTLREDMAIAANELLEQVQQKRGY